MRRQSTFKLNQQFEVAVVRWPTHWNFEEIQLMRRGLAARIVHFQ